MLKFFLCGNNFFMKKIIVFVSILCAFCALSFFKIEKNPIFELKNVEKVCLVSEQEYSDMESVVCGNKFFNYCTLEQAKEKVVELENNIDSMQFYLKGVDFKNLCNLLNVEIVSSIDLGSLKVYCCYSPYAQKSVLIDGKKVNVQIALEGKNIIAGFPMILTGY